MSEKRTKADKAQRQTDQLEKKASRRPAQTRKKKPRLAQPEPAPKPDKIHFDLAVVVMVAFVMVLVAVVMVLVPPAMPPVVMMSITIVISVTIPVAVPIPVSIPITVSVPIAIRCTVAAPGSRTPCSAAPGDNVAVRSIRRNAVVPIHVLHSAFHAANLALIVGLTIALPARVITVKTLLIAC